jgi:probable F420-dependent oxidoreductase
MDVRFGVQGSGQLVDQLPDPRFFRDVATLAEDLGFDSLWAGEHLSYRNAILDVVVALSTFAAATQRIELGAGVVLLPLRHPSLVAKAFASLDYVSGGRVVLGVGVGGEGAKDFEAAGVPIRERGARTDEAMRALRELLRGGPASFAGRFFAFERIEIDPPAARPGGLPLWVGGRSPAAIRRAGTLGDGWIPIWISPERLAEGLEQLPARTVRAVTLPAHVGGTLETLRTYLSCRYGTEFSPEAVDRYCLWGEPERIAERLAAYVRAGARHIVFNPAVPPERIPEQLRLLAELRVEARERT